MECLVLQRVDQRVVVELDRRGLVGAAVNDARRLAFVAQPAARAAATFARAWESGEFETGLGHGVTPRCLRPSLRGPRDCERAGQVVRGWRRCCAGVWRTRRNKAVDYTLEVTVPATAAVARASGFARQPSNRHNLACLLYTSDAADDLLCV